MSVSYIDFGFWGLPGGVLELDEQLETCARRELLEETGLEVGTLRLKEALSCLNDGYIVC